MPAYETSSPTDELRVTTLDVWHPDWLTRLLFADDQADFDVMLDGEPVTYPGVPIELEAGSIADDGQDVRSFTLPDPDGVLWRRYMALIGVLDEDGRFAPVKVTIREWDANDPTEPLSEITLDLCDPQQNEDRSLSVTARGPDLSDRNGPATKFTYANAAGLRR